jgi:hypothetical protein
MSIRSVVATGRSIEISHTQCDAKMSYFYITGKHNFRLCLQSDIRNAISFVTLLVDCL